MILKDRIRNKKKEYLIVWENIPGKLFEKINSHPQMFDQISNNSWEPAKNLKNNQELI